MNARERVLAALNRRPTDHLPVDLWYTPEIGRQLRDYCGVTDDLAMYRHLGLDKIVWTFVGYRSPTDATQTTAQVGAGVAGKRTLWGAQLRGIEAGAAHYDEIAVAPMATLDDPRAVDQFPYWPDPAHFDYDDAIARARAAHGDFAVIGPWVSLFEIYCQLRGLEQALVDVLLAPDLVDAVLDRVEAVQTAMMRRLFDRAADAFDLVFVSDDIGTQNGLLIAPENWWRHLQPRLQRWCDLIHGYGLKVFYHTDGAVEPLIEPLIDSGIDVLNPIQHICTGMQPHALAQRFGNRLIFHGGVDNQHVLPFGSPADVRAEVAMLQRTLGAGGGFICASCHNVQAGTPVDNILAMIDAAHNLPGC